MCYPECDIPYEDYLDAYSQFQRDLTDLLAIKQSSNTKYKRLAVYDNNLKTVYVYMQIGTHNLVRVVVNHSMEASEYKKESVDIYAEDVIIEKQLNNLPSVKIMREKMEICREIVHVDQVLVKLTYDI